MVIYKCNKCGFMDITIGMQAHLIMHPECQDGNFNKYDETGKLKTEPLEKYTTKLTQVEYDKEIKRISEEGIKKKLAKKEKIQQTDTQKNVTFKNDKELVEESELDGDKN